MNNDKEAVELVIKRIRYLCNKNKISYYRFAKNSDILTSTLNSILNGTNTDVRISTIKRICKGFNITLREFFNDDLFD